MREGMGRYRAISVVGASEGKFVYGNLFLCSFGQGHDLSIQQTDEYGTPMPIKIDPSTVGQFTGLKDSKGKDIYEGDRIDWKGMDFADCMQYPDNLIDVVDLCTDYSYEWFRSSINQCEVIGNIHDDLYALNEEGEHPDEH
jgi:hypothetical protein